MTAPTRPYRGPGPRQGLRRPTRGRSTASPSASRRASCSGSSGPTAPARRPRSASWRRCCEPTAGTARVAGFDVTKQPTKCASDSAWRCSAGPRRVLDRPRDPGARRPPAPHAARRDQAPRRRAARADGPDSVAQEAHRHLLRRHEAAARPGQRADASAPGAHPRRADRGPRPAEPHRAVGGAGAHQPAGHDDAADDPLHGRGRSALHAGSRSSTTARSWSRARRAS